MSTYSVPFDDIFTKKGFNHRTVSTAVVEDLSKNIAKYGLLSNITCVQVFKDGEDVVKHKGYQVVDGESRFRALQLLRTENPARFEELFPDAMVFVNLLDVSAADKDALKDRSVISNTYRNALKPHEIYSEILRRHGAKQDTYEIAEVMNLQQPRVSEYLSFQEVCEEVHEAWRNELISNADMLRLSSLSEEEQQSWLSNLSAAVQAAGGDDKGAKQAKANARKTLRANVEENGEKRTYANAGKPSRQKLASYVPLIAVRAVDSEDEAEKTFWGALAAAFKVVNGELDFEKLSPSKSYVTKKDAAEAKKLLAEAEAKAAEKAEKAAAKQEKAKERPAAKKEKEKAATKKPAKKPAKKAGKKPRK
jgi:ParB-like chromosome segregation protein Spo0J